MRCFDKLVKSHFLANVSEELSLARQALESMSSTCLDLNLVFNQKEKRIMYENTLSHFQLLEEVADSMLGGFDKISIYFVEIDTLHFMYSLDQRQIKDAIKYRYNVNGEIPFYAGRHKVNGQTVYTLLYDTRMGFDPIAPN